MPAPKMSLAGYDINQPNYGYVSSIYTTIDWQLVCGNYKGYKKGSEYLTSDFEVMLTEAMQLEVPTIYGSDIALILGTGHGFYPFSPILDYSTYNARMLKHDYQGLLKAPWKHTKNAIGLLWRDLDVTGLPVYTQPETQTVEGNATFSYGINTITGIREVDQPPDIALPENNNTVLSKTGLPYSIEREIAGREMCGITSDIIVSGSKDKVSLIIKFLLLVGIDSFEINMPDFYLFGEKIPMSVSTDSWTVKCISNPIECTHVFLDRFELKLKLALVIA